MKQLTKNRRIVCSTRGFEFREPRNDVVMSGIQISRGKTEALVKSHTF